MVSFACASSDKSLAVDSAQKAAPASLSCDAAGKVEASPGIPLRGVILAVDYGRRRIGLAVSDSLGLTARPLATLARVNRRSDLARLREVCRAHMVRTVIVGWPLRLDGTPGEMAGEAARFAERMRKNLGLPVQLADERLSSWEARRITADGALLEGGQRGKRAGNPLDDVAAAVILRDYLRAGRGAAATEQESQAAGAKNLRIDPSRMRSRCSGRS